jgi:transcriptional regulator with XRE-family HTH domain
MKIREIRQSQGLTQKKLSDLADMELSTLNRIELGKAGTSLNHIFAICEVLEISPALLFDCKSRAN